MREAADTAGMNPAPAIRQPSRFWFTGFQAGSGGVGLCVAAVLLLAVPLHADWRDSLTPDVPGPFPDVRPFEAEFRFGWSEIEAARAIAVVTGSEDELVLSAKGGTRGIARSLYQIDATHECRTQRGAFHPVETVQLESYAGRDIKTWMVAKPDGLWVLREAIPGEPTPPKWKRIKHWPIRDLVSGMMFIRSQRLAPGDEVSVVIYPDSSPFLVDIKVLGTESIMIGGSRRDALKLDLHIQRINLKEGGRLEPHRKFQSGKIWLSNDADRIPLRAEVKIFIGYVFGEIVTFKFTSP